MVKSSRGTPIEIGYIESGSVIIIDFRFMYRFTNR